MNIRYIFVLFILFGLTTIHARDFRVNQIPNGSVNSCRNCHTSSFGGARNDFGSEIEANYLDNAGSSGNVTWGSQLAQIDSDGDGFTNGWELGDPDGNWVIGNDDPGSTQFVTNPGDASSLDVQYAANGESSFMLYQNHPNPFNPSTNIHYYLPTESDVEISIYDIMGNKIRSLSNDGGRVGINTVFWDGANDHGQSVSGGVYLYKLEAGEFSQTKKMIMLK